MKGFAFPVNSDPGQVYDDGRMAIVFHKSPMVELIASLHSLRVGGSPQSQSARMTRGRNSKLDRELRRELDTFGKTYADWLLIMDVATYLSCRHFEQTGRIDCTFDEAIHDLRTLDDVTFLYLFVGMPALGMSMDDAKSWREDPSHINEKQLRLVRQYISRKNIIAAVRSIRDVKLQLARVLEQYWYAAFQYVWTDVEPSINRKLHSAMFDCRLTGDNMRYITYIHPDIHVTSEQLYLKKDITYMIMLDEIRQIHVFPSTFSEQELLIDRVGDTIVLYYNLNMREILDTITIPEDLGLVFKALADPSRMKIVRLLWGSPATTSYLSYVMGLAPSTVSGHLKLMLQAGILRSQTIKQYVYYEVDRTLLENLGDRMLDFIRAEPFDPGAADRI